MKLLLARALHRIGDRLLDAGMLCIRWSFQLCDMPIPAEREHIDTSDRPFGLPPDVPAVRPARWPADQEIHFEDDNRRK